MQVGWPGFRGAFLHGSICWLPDDALLPATSDVDVIVLVNGGATPGMREKHRAGSLVLDVSSMTLDELPSPEEALGQYHLAGSFRRPAILADPTGRLTEIGAVVSARFAERQWVWARCGHAQERAERFLGQVDAADALPEAVTYWLFGTGVLTHVLLTAGLRNPTVRTRYLTVRSLLAEYGHLDHYEELRALLGCVDMTAEQVAEHVGALEPLFRAASLVAPASLHPLAADLSMDSYRATIGGSRELIERGDHREAVFWVVATFCRCLILLDEDPSGAVTAEELAAFEHAFHRLLADLGITTAADLRQRGERSRAAIPRVWEVAHAIIAANPEIVG